MTLTRLSRAAVLVLLASAQGALAECRADAVDLRGDWGNARFSVEVVDTPATRARGLMFRENMPRSAGMLFVYEAPGPVAFWMKNTLIPLDMVFVGEDGRVDHVHSNAIPGDLTAIPGGEEIQFVLEINAGLAEGLGIGPGSEMRHPAIGPDAVWPCDE